jgi:MFS family permease
LWRNRAFLRLWAAFSVSEVGSQVTLLALPLTAIVVLKASPLAVGLLTTAGFLPYVLVGLPSGVLVDRVRPLPLLIGGDIGRALLLGSIPVAALAGWVSLPQLYLVAFAAGSLSVVFGVAHQATIHRIVAREDLIDANAKVELSDATAQVTGPGLGGFLIGALSAPLAIAVDALSFAVSAAVLLGLPTSETGAGGGEGAGAPAAREPALAQIREGLRFILFNPVLRAVAASLALINLFAAVFDTVMLIYFVRVLHLGPATIGLVVAAAGAGAVVGAATATRLARRIGVGRVILIGSLPAGMILVPLAPIANPIPFLIAGNFLSSVLIIAYNITQRGLRQAITPARMQGRMTATMRFLIVSPAPLGSLLGGVLGSAVGLRPTLFVGVLGTFLMVVPILLSPIPGIRDIPQGPVEEVAPPTAGLPLAEG